MNFTKFSSESFLGQSKEIISIFSGSNMLKKITIQSECDGSRGLDSEPVIQFLIFFFFSGVKINTIPSVRWNSYFFTSGYFYLKHIKIEPFNWRHRLIRPANKKYFRPLVLRIRHCFIFLKNELSLSIALNDGRSCLLVRNIKIAILLHKVYEAVDW